MVGIPVLFGCLAIVKGLRHGRRTEQLIATGQHATAVVVDNQEQRRSEGRTQYLPVVTFRTAVGSECRAVLEDEISYRSHLAQTPIAIIYDPADPTRITTAGKSPNAGRTGAVILGLVFIAFGVVAFLLTRSMLPGIDDGYLPTDQYMP